MVTRPENPAASARLAQSIKTSPGVSGTGFGRPIPIFTRSSLAGLDVLGKKLVLLTLLRRGGSKESDGWGRKSAVLEQLGMS